MQVGSQHELEDRNQIRGRQSGRKASNDERLTLHRPRSVYGDAGPVAEDDRMAYESINALIEERCAKVDHCAELESTPSRG